MNNPNPFEPPSVETEASSWRTFDFLVAGIWVAIPVGVALGRRVLLPIFADFGVALFKFTQVLLSPYAPISFAAAALVVLLVVLTIPHGRPRSRLIRLAGLAGLLVVAWCLLGFLIPLFFLAWNLM